MQYQSKGEMIGSRMREYFRSFKEGDMKKNTLLVALLVVLMLNKGFANNFIMASKIANGIYQMNRIGIL